MKLFAFKEVIAVSNSHCFSFCVETFLQKTAERGHVWRKTSWEKMRLAHNFHLVVETCTTFQTPVLIQATGEKPPAAVQHQPGQCPLLLVLLGSAE